MFAKGYGGRPPDFGTRSGKINATAWTAFCGWRTSTRARSAVTAVGLCARGGPWSLACKMLPPRACAFSKGRPCPTVACKHPGRCEPASPGLVQPVEGHAAPVQPRHGALRSSLLVRPGPEGACPGIAELRTVMIATPRTPRARLTFGCWCARFPHCEAAAASSALAVLQFRGSMATGSRPSETG